MAVLEQRQFEGNSGFKKKFEEGTEEILFDFIQGTQYQYPVQSAIRELFSNASDSIREKLMYFKIKDGKAKVSDFYVEVEGDLYKDSKYDPTYYNPKWLSRNKNNVQLVYKVNNTANRDTFHIIDTGVGLGGKRLEKHFNPLFSTKRANTQQLGKFGVGSKAGLALDIEYYTLITRYNGLEFHFNVFNYKVDSIVPRFNMETEQENPYYDCLEQQDNEGKPIRFYAYKTEEKNGVEVILQAKKGLKREFIDAVKSQLLYMKDVSFDIVEDGVVIPQKVQADIMYEDEIFIMPDKDSTYYVKPHLVLNDVCYGYISFLQLEEEDRVGNIGIKVDPSKVDITLNRESVRWTEKTRNAIHEVFKEGETIAAKVLEKELNTTDILDWLRKMNSWIRSTDKDSIIGRFSNIVDVKSMKPVFSPMPYVDVWGQIEHFFTDVEILRISSTNKYSKTRGYNFKTLERKGKVSWSELGSLPLFFGEQSYRKEMYLLTLHPDGFVRITPKALLNTELEEMTEEETSLAELPYTDKKGLTGDEYVAMKAAQEKRYLNRQKKLYQLLLESQFTKFYKDVIVPEDFKLEGHKGETEEEEEEDAVAEAITSSMTPEQRRKLEEKILVTSWGPSTVYTPYFIKEGEYQYPLIYRAAREVKAKDILYDKAEVIYGFQEDEANLCLVAELMCEWSEKAALGGSIFNDELKICMTSQANAKYFKPHTYVNDFFMSFNPETKTISMHNRLVKWQTARKVEEILEQLRFLRNFDVFDISASELYKELVNYVSLNSIDLKAYMTASKSTAENAQEVVSNLEGFADKVTDLQLYIARHPNEQKAIAAKCKALFETDEDSAFQGALGVEIEVYDKAVRLLENSAFIKVLLNEMGVLRQQADIPLKLEQEIRDYLDFKQYIVFNSPQLAPQTVNEDEAFTL